MNADQAAHDGHGQAVAAKMYTGSLKRKCNIEPIIDQELALARCGKLLNPVCKSEQIPRTQISFSNLDGSATGLQCLRQHGHQWPVLRLVTIRDQEQT